MIDNINYPYPNEFLFYFINRIHILNQHDTISETMLKMFGSKSYIPSTYFQAHLNFLCQQLTGRSIYTPEFFIKNHTIYPLFKPFLWEQYNLFFINRMIYGNSKSITKIIGIQEMSRYKYSEYKLCKQCAQEDDERYGETYLRTSHQVPWNYFCQTHKNALSTFAENLNKHKHFNINKLKECFIPYQINQSLYVELMHFSEDIQKVLDGKLCNLNLLSVNKKYKKALQEKGFIWDDNTITYLHLHNEFLKHYQEDYLDAINCNLNKSAVYRYSYPKYKGNAVHGNDWLARISACHSYIVHPIRHLVFIRFLFGSIENFLKY